MALVLKPTGSKEIKTTDGKPFEISEEGSLGLLALGYVGLMAWRAKKKEVESMRRSAPN